MMHFQPLDLLADRFWRHQQGWHHHHGAQALRHALQKFQAGQRFGVRPMRGDQIHHGNRGVGGGNNRQHGQQPDAPAESTLGGPVQHPRDDRQAQQTNRCQIAGDSNRGIGLGEPAGERAAIANHTLEIHSASGDQIIARFMPTRGHRCTDITVIPSRLLQGELGDFDL